MKVEGYGDKAMNAKRIETRLINNDFKDVQGMSLFTVTEMSKSPAYDWLIYFSFDKYETNETNEIVTMH